MSENLDFKELPIGADLGTREIFIDKETVDNYAKIMQWDARELIDKLGIVPPGMTFSKQVGSGFEKVPGQYVAIWAKSEHEFFKPLKIGSKIFIHGKIVDKYVKRGKNYQVSEFETLDESGNVLLKSRETGIRIE